MASVQELTNKLGALEPFITKINALDSEKVYELPEIIEEVQKYISVNQDIFSNSLKIHIDGEVLSIEPISQSTMTGVPVFPAIPSSNGTYILKSIVENGRTVISWIPKNDVEA